MDEIVMKCLNSEDIWFFARLEVIAKLCFPYLIKSSWVIADNNSFNG